MDNRSISHDHSHVVWNVATDRDLANCGSSRSAFHRRIHQQGQQLMETLKTLILRIVAVFGSSALAAVAGGAVLDVQLWKAAAIAGIVAAAKVTESLLRAWSSDGVLTKEEIAEAFGKAK
jgi:hypothetical protein